MYKRDINRRFVKSIYKGNICITQGTNKNHIRLRPKVYNGILKGLYSKIKNLNGDFNSILPINRQTNKETEPDIKIIFITLRQLCTEKLGIITTSYIVYI